MEDSSSERAPCLVLEVLGDCMKLPSTTATQLTVMAKLRASSAEQEGESRAPITICAVIDRSDSMKDHLPLLKDTLQFMIQQLRSRDQLCLVTFDDEVCTELPLTAMTADGKLKAERAVNRVKERGRTNLSGGLLAALQTLYHIQEDKAALVESVLLFTDGKANVGIRDQLTITKATKGLLDQINRQVCVFTFGYGSEHDADMLLSIAEAGNGLFYYIDNPESIPESFCDCLGGLLSVAAQNVRLSFTGGPGVVLNKPVTSYKVTQETANHSYQVTIPDIYCEEERCILATASLPADLALQDPTSVTIVTCKVEFVDVLSSKQREGEVMLSVVRNRFLEQPMPSDARDEIELHQIRCEVASTLGQANKMANAGKLPAAKEMLVRVKGKLAGSKVASRPLAKYLVCTVDESLGGLEDEDAYIEHGKAVMNNYSLSHWQQRSNTTPSQESYLRAKGGIKRPPRVGPPRVVTVEESPYRNASKVAMMHKHASSTSSSSSKQ